MKSLSLIVPTLGRKVELLNLIDDLSRQYFSNFELLIINQGERLDLLKNIDTDNLSFDIRFFYLKVPNASIARNIGALEASSDLILLLDDDVRISDRNFLKKHLEAFIRSGKVGVYGQVLELGECETFECSDLLLASPLNWHMLKANFGVQHFTRNGGAGNLLLNREYYLAVGGMNRVFTRGARREETEFNMRYTKKFGPFLFCPECSLTHLSAPGGSRTWGRIKRTVPYHHLFGLSYFMICCFTLRTVSFVELSREIRYYLISTLKNPLIGESIWIKCYFFPLNLIRALLALTHAAATKFNPFNASEFDFLLGESYLYEEEL